MDHLPSSTSRQPTPGHGDNAGDSSVQGGEGDDSVSRERERKRVRLACQLCKKRKIRCDGVPQGCETCKNLGVVCNYVDSGIKRGPRRGYKLERQQSQSQQQQPQTQTQPRQQQPQDTKHNLPKLVSSSSGGSGGPSRGIGSIGGSGTNTGGAASGQAPNSGSSAQSGHSQQGGSHHNNNNNHSYHPYSTSRSPIGLPSVPTSSSSSNFPSSNNTHSHTQPYLPGPSPYSLPHVLTPLTSSSNTSSGWPQPQHSHSFSSNTHHHNQATSLPRPPSESPRSISNNVSLVHYSTQGQGNPSNHFTSSSAGMGGSGSGFSGIGIGSGSGSNVASSGLGSGGGAPKLSPSGLGLGFNPNKEVVNGGTGVALPGNGNIGGSHRNNSIQGMPSAISSSTSYQPQRNVSTSGGAKDFEVDQLTQEGLLGVYFMHIHNVWPLIYKPAFHANTVPRALLLAILSAAAVIPNSAATLIAPADADSLFQQAQELVTGPDNGDTPAWSANTAQGHRNSLHELKPFKSQIHILQILLLFSLRQTSKGNKSSAYMWACKAFGMALELGLNRAGPTGAKGVTQADSETRSRVFWCCYVLDKTFSEETGRPFILRAKTTTIPLPSVHEADEFELWPPPSAPLPPPSATGRNRMQPTRARTISCFNSTCRLGYLVEQLLDMDSEISAPNGGGAHGAMSVMEDRSRQIIPVDDEASQDESEMMERQKVRIGKRLDEWFSTLEDELRVDVQTRVCPPTHFVVNLTWYHSAVILLHARFIALKPTSAGKTGLYGTSHQICTHAAESIVALLSCLDRFKVMAASSSDVLHMLSHAALFHAYNSALPNQDQASSADVNFQQCCLWLKEIGDLWAPASAHRLFFEGLMKGGKEIRRMRPNGGRANTAPLSREGTPANDSPSMPTSFARGGREEDLNASADQRSGTPNTDIFRARSHFWNELIPNADLFNAYRMENDLGFLNPSLDRALNNHHTSSSTYSMPQSSQQATNDSYIMGNNNGANNNNNNGVGQMSYMNGTDPFQQYLGDPADMLVAYMLDSVQQNQ